MPQEPQQDLLNPEELHIIKYGTFWPRFWALFIDGLILAILVPVTIYNQIFWKNLIVLFAITLVQVGYKSFFEFMYNATPGKMALGLKVISDRFEKPSLKEVLLRNIFQIASVVAAFSLSLFSFFQPDFINATTLAQYGHLGSSRTIGIVINSSITIIYIIDLIVMLSSDNSKSLHDRIGGTFVIKK